MWFLQQSNVFPVDLTQSGVYLDFLSPEFASTLLIEHRRIGLNYLWQLCPTPASIRFIDSYKSIIYRWLDIHVQLTNHPNQLQQNRLYLLKNCIDELCHCMSINNQDIRTISCNAKRSELNTHLTDYPLYSTLLFIHSIPDEGQKNTWLWLLARLQLCMENLTYEQLLDFDNARRTLSQEDTFILSDIKELSQIELSNLCRSSPELRRFSHYFISPPNPTRKRKPYHPYKSDNEYKDNMTTALGQSITVCTPVDRDGNEKSAFYELDDPTFKDSPSLTHDQAKRHYQFHRVGVENAIARNNQKLPMSMAALTPSELQCWLTHHCPELFTNQLNRLTEEDRICWFLFFLRLLLGNIKFNPILFNQANKLGDSPEDTSITYILDKKGDCASSLRLSTRRLFKGKQAPQGAKQYYSNQTYIELKLPWPLGTLLNLILRTLPANKRHNIPLDSALARSASEQNKWLSTLIKESKPTFPFKVTPNALFHAFQHFYAQSLPSVWSDYLNQNGSVLMHYVNVETSAFSSLLNRHWFHFITLVGVPNELGWSSQTDSGSTLNDTFHQQIGSAITLRDTLFRDLFEALLSPIESQDRQISDTDCSQRIGLYLHIRTAVELALRPVKAPYPLDKNCAWSAGIMVVQDKRVHHNEERRLLILSEELSGLLQDYQKFSQNLRPHYCPSHAPCLSVLIDDQWQAMSPQVISRLSERYLAPIDPGSFRHLCAHQIIHMALEPHGDFQQSELNQKMNHYKRGQNTLGEFSLCSISTSVEVQRRMQKKVKHYNAANHTHGFWASVEKWDVIITNKMRQYKPKGGGC
ncbi:hypothetical protein FCV60_08925 [Vibrio sp. F13]|uniref:hypothetical protein n=1 Tax=Vibrio sp. F13 TaxID=2070777 RepID=UPI0010BD2118|nr:hypothetical protein [Vibrio sp. F13]TKF54674.1 hypothetical protein FCV60_08925 [Vibrio sp. F13]